MTRSERASKIEKAITWLAIGVTLIAATIFALLTLNPAGAADVMRTECTMDCSTPVDPHKYISDEQRVEYARFERDKRQGDKWLENFYGVLTREGGGAGGAGDGGSSGGNGE